MLLVWAWCDCEEVMIGVEVGSVEVSTGDEDGTLDGETTGTVETVEPETGVCVEGAGRGVCTGEGVGVATVAAADGVMTSAEAGETDAAGLSLEGTGSKPMLIWARAG